MSNSISERRVQRHAPIREQVASIIRDAIANMELLPGQVLIERELCEMISASRPSVREALRQLESEGLLESRTGRGTVVAAPDYHQARQLYEVRAELEGMAASLFTQRANEAEKQALQDAFDEVERTALAAASDKNVGNEMLTAKGDLYKIIVDGADNEILSELVGGLLRRVTQLRALTMSAPGRMEESLEEVRKIIDAIQQGNAEAARDAAIYHVEQAAEIALGFIKD